MINIGLPLTPFLIGGLVRLLALLDFSSGPFVASELAICLAFICILTNQSLDRKPLLDNDDKKKERATWKRIFLGIAVLLIVLFALIVLFEALVRDLNLSILQGRLWICNWAAALGVLVVPLSVRVQLSFDLEADLL